MAGQTDRQTEWHVEVSAPPNKQMVLIKPSVTVNLEIIFGDKDQTSYQSKIIKKHNNTKQTGYSSIKSIGHLVMVA